MGDFSEMCFDELSFLYLKQQNKSNKNDILEVELEGSQKFSFRNIVEANLKNETYKFNQLNHQGLYPGLKKEYTYSLFSRVEPFDTKVFIEPEYFTDDSTNMVYSSSPDVSSNQQTFSDIYESNNDMTLNSSMEIPNDEQFMNSITIRNTDSENIGSENLNSNATLLVDPSYNDLVELILDDAGAGAGAGADAGVYLSCKNNFSVITNTTNEQPCCTNPSTNNKGFSFQDMSLNNLQGVNLGYKFLTEDKYNLNLLADLTFLSNVHLCDSVPPNDIKSIYCKTYQKNINPQGNDESPLMYTFQGFNYSNNSYLNDTIKNKKKRLSKGSQNPTPKLIHLEYNDVMCDYTIEYSTLLTNIAFVQIPQEKINYIYKKLVKIENKSEDICNIKRTRYVRSNVDLLNERDKHLLVVYEKNPNFNLDKPYEPEFIRVQIDERNGKPFNETRCGLCPYCAEIHFLNLKTSTYAQHLSLSHGIHTDNYLTPNPINYGDYKLKKENKNRKTIAHTSIKSGVVCPVCHDIVEAKCSIVTAAQKPLNNYLRHFRTKHRQSRFKDDSTKFFTDKINP